MVIWSIHQQKTISLSTCEAKYVAASEAASELKWLRMLLGELEFMQLLRHHYFVTTMAASFFSRIHLSMHTLNK